MADIIRFFTKSGELILDPFAGVGGTLLGALLSNRDAVGIELNPVWTGVYKEIIKKFTVKEGCFVPVSEAIGVKEILPEMILGDCLEVLKSLPEEKFDVIISDPPYGCNHCVSGFKKETNFNMFNDQDKRDIGNSESYQEYLDKIELFGIEAYRVLKTGRYMVLLIGDRYHQGEYYPLGYQVAEIMRKVGFKWKGIRIWWNKATQRPLKPYAIKQCFIPNITHQNIIIMRK